MLLLALRVDGLTTKCASEPLNITQGLPFRAKTSKICLPQLVVQRSMVVKAGILQPIPNWRGRSAWFFSSPQFCEQGHIDASYKIIF
jgi:hypothetical protein